MSEVNIEVLIIGGGPAGSSAGISLIKEKIDCLLIDKSIFPREKLCGGLITEVGIKELRNLGINIDSNVFYKPTTIRFFDGYKRIFEYESEADFAVVDRYVFDKILIDEYISLGGKTILGEKIIKIDLVDRNALTDKGTIINYKYLIGADGANSLVKKLINKKKNELAFCCEVYAEKESIDKYPSDGINVIFNKIPIGFGWVFERHDKSAIGIGGLIDNNKEVLRLMSEIYKVPDNIRIKGAFVPYGKLPHVCSNDRVFLIGDAGGYVDPILGEGISLAILSGRKITRVLKSIDKKKAYINEFKDFKRIVQYGNLYQKIFFAKFVNKKVLKIFRDHKNMTKRLCENIVMKGNLRYFEVLKIVKVILNDKF